MGRQQFPDPQPLLPLADTHNGLQRPQGVKTATGRIADAEAIEAHNRGLQVARVGQAIRDYREAFEDAQRAWLTTQGGNDRQSAAHAQHESNVRKLVAQRMSVEQVWERLGEPRHMSNAYATRVAELYDEKCSTALAVLRGTLSEFAPPIEAWCREAPGGKQVLEAVNRFVRGL